VRTNHKLLDLFSGIGGFSLGAERNGIETIGFVEKDEFCQKVLKKHWSDVPIIDDIRKVNGKDFGSATIISGGFPCQPFSVAGKRKGTDDDRYLWDEMLRVISSCKPTWVIGENVEGIINIQDGMVLRSVQDDLEREGFQVQCLVIPASGIGAWHQRRRVWIIGCNPANKKNDTNTNSSRLHREKMHKHGERKSINRKERYTKQICKTLAPLAPTRNVSNANSGELHGCISTSRICRTKHHRMDSNKKRNGNEVWSETERCSSQNTERENVSDSIKNGLEIPVIQSNNIQTTKAKKNVYRSFEKQQTWWQTESELRGVPNGVSHELHSDRADRIKALGNSIVPQIAEQIFRSIIDAE
tara:strand:+ start:155 stop:1225 length:1071 start_codon:yes stop_codon:yes gene_type:complete